MSQFLKGIFRNHCPIRARGHTVEQMSDRHQVGLSAQVVKTADQMLGTLIDLKA